MNFKGLAAGVALALLASQAEALTFTGSYTVSPLNTNGVNGLALATSDLTPGPGRNFTFELNTVGESVAVNLFRLYTPETFIQADDEVPAPLSIAFNFVGGSSGSLHGETRGYVSGNFHNAGLSWQSESQLLFGNGGVLNLAANPAFFNGGENGTTPGIGAGYDVFVFFRLDNAPGAVPEPATWALMIGGFGLAGAALRSRKERKYVV